MLSENWEVSYPSGLIKYIDYFRQKNMHYDKYDEVLVSYIKQYKKSSGNRICLLGSGTGTRGYDLSKRGHYVVGIERHKESVDIATNRYKNQENLEFLQGDFLDFNEMERVLSSIPPFDVVAMLAIPLSMKDHAIVGQFFSRYLVSGGLFVTALWGWTEEVDLDQEEENYDIEFATNPSNDQDFAVRINHFRYIFHKNIIEWNAFYLYPEKDGFARLVRDHDLLEVVPSFKENDFDPLGLEKEGYYEVLPPLLMTGYVETPPYVFEYLIGWRRR